MRCPTLKDLPPPPPGKTGWPWTEESPQLPDTLDGKPWPRISIVTPSYQQASYIEETLRSILLQGYPDLEYIVMDGGSSDGSVEIIRKYEPWISYLHIGPDGGQSAAIAEGFRHATGEVLAWLNSDDRYNPGALGRVGRFFAAQPRAVFGGGDMNRVDSEGRLIKRIFAVRPNPFLLANLGNHVMSQPSSFWRRSAYEQVGGVDPRLRFCMDRDLFVRLFAAGPSLRIPGPPLADFREHPEAKSSTILDVHRHEKAELLERYGRSPLRAFPWLLTAMWNLWYRPVGVRRRLNRAFGWEY